MAGIICIVIGFLMNAINVYIPIGISFPEYERTNEMGQVIQTYVTHNILHSGVTIDVLPNVMGGILFIIGCMLLRKRNKKIRKAIPYFFGSILGIVLLNALPFYLNGRMLIIVVLATSFLMFLSQIRGEYIMIYQYSNGIESMEIHREVQTLKFGWIASIMSMVFVYYLNIVGLDTMKTIYSCVYFLFVLLVIYQILKVEKYYNFMHKL